LQSLIEQKCSIPVCPLKSTDCRTLPLWQGLNEVVSQYLGGFTVRDLMRTDPDGGDYII
jgi:hypothetical protein